MKWPKCLQHHYHFDNISFIPEEVGDEQIEAACEPCVFSICSSFSWQHCLIWRKAGPRAQAPTCRQLCWISHYCSLCHESALVSSILLFLMIWFGFVIRKCLPWARACSSAQEHFGLSCLSYQLFAQFWNTIHSFIFREVIQSFGNCGLITDAAFSCQCLTSASLTRSR